MKAYEKSVKQTLIKQAMGAELLAQGVAIDSEHISGLALITANKFHYTDQQRTLGFTKDALMQTRRRFVAVDGCEVVAQIAVDTFGNGF